MAVKSIPDGYHTLTPYLIVRGGAKAIEFYKKAFGAIELGERHQGPDGKVGHAEMQIGSSRFMLADEFPDMGAISPQTLGGSPVNLLIYVDDVDTIVKQATDAGATIVRPVQNQFYGDRSGQLNDPFGHIWTVATHIEDVTDDEIKKRAAALYPNKG